MKGEGNVPNVVVFEPGGYRYISGVFQYSAGVAAEPGFLIERARLAKPLPLLEGFAAVEAHLAEIGRPTTAFCACELRSPAPFTEEGFTAFNRQYVTTLERWGLYKDGVNPVARTNVCPEFDKPGEPSLYAFSYTVPAETGHGGFIVAGSGEAKEATGYRNSIVRFGETSIDALRDKAAFVLAEMESRLTALGFTWADASSAQVYTVHDIGPLVAEQFARAGMMPNGFSWHFTRPPVVDIEFEMDVRGAAREIVL
jgi:hypothetical protein